MEDLLLGSIYEKYGLPRVIPYISKSDDLRGYEFLLSKMPENNFYILADERPMLPKLEKAGGKFFVRAYTKETPGAREVEFSFLPNLKAMGVSSMLLDGAVTVPLDDLFPDEPFDIEAGKILAAVESEEGWDGTLPDREFLLLADMDTERFIVITDSIGPYYLIFLNEFFMLEFSSKLDGNFGYSKLPIEKIMYAASLDKVSVLISFGRITYEISNRSDVNPEDESFVPEFLR